LGQLPLPLPLLLQEQKAGRQHFFAFTFYVPAALLHLLQLFSAL